MTSIAYHQYCNISYNGGSYVCSPIKGPLSTSQTPGTIENKNRGITYAQNGQPVKDANCNNESSNSQDRRMFKEMVITVPGRLQQKLMGAYDASERSSLLRTIAVGTSGFNKANQALSFKSVHVQDSNRALNKLRRVGGAVPPKVQAKILPPPTSVANVRDNAHLQKQSKNSPNVKLSVFMPRHLRSRIECTSGCDGGEIVVDHNNVSDAVIGSENATSYETLDNMNTLVVGKDNDGNTVILINTISPILTNTRNISTGSKQYGLGEGSYLFSNVDKDHAFTILNHNKEELIRLIGDDDKMFTKKVFGITYTFYYGDVILDVIDNFGMMSLYTYNYDYAGGKFALVYGEYYTTETNGLKSLAKYGNQISINQDEEEGTGLYYRISSPYNSNQGSLVRQQYGLGIGTYLFSNVPMSLAFTLLNKGNNNIFLTSSSSDNNETLSRNIDGEQYIFHHGNVTIHVVNDFKYMDFVPYTEVFKIGRYIFKYHPSFTIQPSPVTETPSELVESDDTTLPITLYSYNSSQFYTFNATAIIIKPLTDIDVTKFTKFTIDPELPSWLTFNQGNGYITGYTIDTNDAFYLKQYKVIAYLQDGKIKIYNVHLVMFNQETVIDPNFLNYSVFVKTPENESLYKGYNFIDNIPGQSLNNFDASTLPPNIITSDGNLKTIILNEYSCTTIWANDDGRSIGYLSYPLGININVQAPSGWTIYVGQFARVENDDTYHGKTTPIAELDTGKETITDFITFINDFVGPSSPNYQKIYYPPYQINGSYNSYTYRIYAKKN
jgi:hypothetical protein|uniref:Uncharacterized protein n=1 Tax=viral metagenome TaxID=1070528 RepID=A0A6C0ILN5_9ZZZZ